MSFCLTLDAQVHTMTVVSRLQHCSVLPPCESRWVYWLLGTSKYVRDLKKGNIRGRSGPPSNTCRPIWFLGPNKLHSRRHTYGSAVFAGLIHQKTQIHCNECMKITLKIQQFTNLQQKFIGYCLIKLVLQCTRLKFSPHTVLNFCRIFLLRTGAQKVHILQHIFGTIQDRMKQISAKNCTLVFILRNSRNILRKSVKFYLEWLHWYSDLNFFGPPCVYNKNMSHISDW